MHVCLEYRVRGLGVSGAVTWEETPLALLVPFVPLQNTGSHRVRPQQKRDTYKSGHIQVNTTGWPFRACAERGVAEIEVRKGGHIIGRCAAEPRTGRGAIILSTSKPQFNHLMHLPRRSDRG